MPRAFGSVRCVNFWKSFGGSMHTVRFVGSTRVVPKILGATREASLPRRIGHTIWSHVLKKCELADLRWKQQQIDTKRSYMHQHDHRCTLCVGFENLVTVCLLHATHSQSSRSAIECHVTRRAPILRRWTNILKSKDRLRLAARTLPELSP